MEKLTAPGAEQKLFAELEPQLKQFDATYQQQVPMYVAMGSAWLQGMVQQSTELSDTAKQQALAAINALATWVQKTRFTEPDSVRKVIAIAVRAAREVNLKTLDEARALGFDQSMQKARIALNGFKEALAVYGFSVDATLDSIKPEAVSNDGKTAKVKVAYDLLGTPLSTTVDMVSADGRWYSKETIERMNEHREEAAAAAPPAPAPDAPPPQAGKD
jgi:isopentenyl diphosphate isomerase/L-lactate dehydrogenase-like FMN-dependent dehydrogenase